MRIIAGTWRGRRIAAPPSTATRPYTDRVREAVFDVLGSLLGTPGRLPPVVVLDLFAGGGAMGLEALSRGAVNCLFVENHPSAIRQLRLNVESLGAEGRCRILAVDAWRLRLASLPDGQLIDLVFVDPPYRVSSAAAGGRTIPDLLGRLAEPAFGGAVGRSAILVLRHERAVRFDPAALPGYEIIDGRSYGRMSVTFLTFSAPPRTKVADA